MAVSTATISLSIGADLNKLAGFHIGQQGQRAAASEVPEEHRRQGAFSQNLGDPRRHPPQSLSGELGGFACAHVTSVDPAATRNHRAAHNSK
ncbi:hypothetical protein [Actinoplanes sp. NPDC049265]|uniref:hypothetical protein n=1 Tax=Actinoplanes sp. NPDC049265 TaxID=3363902 RepID=UPI0037182B42